MPSRFDLTYYDPPKEIARHVLALFHFACDEDEISDRHPGALGQLVLMPCGEGKSFHRDDGALVSGPAIMFAGFETAAPFVMKGPWHAIGASLSPLGWAALTKRSAKDYFDRFLDPEPILGPDIGVFAHATNAAYRSGVLSGKRACDALAQWIAPRLNQLPRDHEILIEKAFEWLGSSLSPDVDTLFSSLEYSRRQAERLVMRYFGLSPRALARKYRAVRAASLLAQPELTDEAEAEIAGAFYDQPHMIREIRRYCGYTPTRLGGEGEPIFQAMLRLKNLDRLKGFRTIGQTHA